MENTIFSLLPPVLAALLGILIFIDDYINALAVGQVSRPITDRHLHCSVRLHFP